MKVIGAGDHDFTWCTDEESWLFNAFQCPDCKTVSIKHGMVERSDGAKKKYQEPYFVPVFFGLFHRTKYKTAQYIIDAEVYKCTNCNKVWLDDYFYELNNIDAPGYE